MIGKIVELNKNIRVVFKGPQQELIKWHSALTQCAYKHFVSTEIE